MTPAEISRRVDAATDRFAPATVRALLALLWLSNVSWKVPPSFGESANGCGGLCGFVQHGIDHPVFPGSSWFFETIVQPQLGAFGWFTLIGEATLAALFISGRHFRAACALSIAMSFGIMASVANAPGEWYWSYLLMAGLSLAGLALAPRTPTTSPRLMASLVAGYGVVVALAHAEAGFTGDGNAEWTLFASATDLPGDFGRNVFPGSIALGLGIAAIGAALWFAGRLGGQLGARVGGVIVALAALLLLTYDTGGLAIGLGSRATTASLLAAAGLSLMTVSGEAEQT